jgi:excisionase family DNA binding protein
VDQLPFQAEFSGDSSRRKISSTSLTRATVTTRLDDVAPARDSDDPCRRLAEALGTVVREAVRDALQEIGVGSSNDTTTLVSVPEAATRLGIGMTKLRELIARRDLPSVVVGKRRLLRPADLEAFATRQASGD